MIVVRIGQRTHDGQPVGLSCQSRQMLAHLHARHRGGDRFKGPANLGRGFRFRVEGLVLGRPARQVDHDDRTLHWIRRRTGFRSKQVGQRHPSQAEAADPETLRREKIQEYEDTFANPYVAAGLGYLDDVIDPMETRPQLIAALRNLRNKRQELPRKKHGNLPL